jgi:4-amino-4-deoxy-L-arabinose transferase-like glycosyltransferase
MIASLSFIVQHAVALVLLLVGAAAAGTAIAGRHLPLGMRATLGLAVAGQLFVLLATIGALRPWTLSAFFILALGGGLVRMRRGGFRRRRPSEAAAAPRRVLVASMGAVLTIAAVLLFVLALYPPIAFDETLYHLPFVRSIARSGAIRFLPDVRYPIFPLVHELLCVPGFLALGDVSTHLVSLAEVFLLVALLLEWPRPLSARLLAACLVLGNPIVIHLGTITYVESALMLFVAAGFFCLDRAARHRPLLRPATGPCQRAVAGPHATTPAPDTPAWYAAAGFFLGTACSVKYLGWYFAAAGVGFVLLFSGKRWRAVVIFLLSFAAAVLPMYSRIVALSGNPFFPFLPRLFGRTPWTFTVSEVASRPTRALRLFWDVTFARERLNQQPPYSPLFAVAILFMIVVAVRSRRAAFLCATCAGYVVIFVFMPQDSRYLLPLLPLVSIGAATATVMWIGSRPSGQTILLALSLMAIAPGIAYAGYRLAKQGFPPVEPAQRRLFLERRIPEYRALERRGPGRIYVCGAEQLKYFGGDEILGDVDGPVGTEKIVGSCHNAAELAAALGRLDVRYLLVSRRACRQQWQHLPSWPAFEPVYADAGAVIWRSRFPSDTESR